MASGNTSHIATSQPIAASRSASSRPMPAPPPVTTAIFPSKLFMPTSQAALILMIIHITRAPISRSTYQAFGSGDRRLVPAQAWLSARAHPRARPGNPGARRGGRRERARRDRNGDPRRAQLEHAQRTGAPVGRTEIDFINGVIAEKGREVGVPTPSHVKLIEAVKRVEHGQIPAKPENLYAI